jgi:prophage DNA circulation protein
MKRGVSRTNYLLANTDRRISKAVGGYAPDFSLELFIHDIDGDRYEQKRKEFIKALDGDEPGTLVHPFLGNFFCVAGVYEVKETFSEVGVCRFSVAFFVVDKEGANPAVTESGKATPGGIKDKALVANRALQSASADAFLATTAINKLSNAGKIRDMAGSFNDKLSVIADTVEQGIEYTDKAIAVAEKASFYTGNPLIAFADLADLVLGTDGLALDAYSKFRALQNLFEEVTESSSSTRIVALDRIQTREEAERYVSSNVSDTFLQASSLIEAFSQASTIEYKNVQEINSAMEILDAQYERIKEQMYPERAQIGDSSRGEAVVEPDYDDTYEAINSLRTDSIRLFEELRTTAPKVEIITVNQQPASVIAYTLYGDSTRADEIIDLNEIDDAFAVSGQILVLSK